MKCEIHHPRRQQAAAYLLISTATILLIAISFQFLAYHLSQSADGRDLRLAVTLDPLNAEYYEKLGRLELIDRQSPQRALFWLSRATALNPGSSTYWLQRASAEGLEGNVTAERASLREAAKMDPRSAGIAWEISNLDFAQGDTDSALLEYRRVMANDPTLAPEAIQMSWRILPDADSLLEKVVPPEADNAFLNFLIVRHESKAAEKVWARMVALRQPVTRSFLFEYLQYLFANREPVQAKRVWQQSAVVAGLAAYQSSDENLMVNGDFSLDVLNGGFDWTYEKTPAVTLALDPVEAYASSRSLRIVFEGPGIADAGIRQVVAVDPDTQYQFSAAYKTAEMDGAGGPRFAIQDLYGEQMLFMSDDLRNADGWARVTGSFQTGPDTQLVMVKIVRVPAASPIRGKLWIADLKLLASGRAVANDRETP